jgi:NADH-quinone oxidoreductase subunit D
MFESTCGARLTYSYITIGGVTDDLPENFVDVCNEFLDYFEPKIVEYNDLLSYNHIFVKRTGNVGIISAADAIAYGLSGPVLRGSGVKFDLRKAAPYEVYDRLEFDIPVGKPGGRDGIPRGVVPGDCWSRYYVRVVEMEESVKIIRQCLRDLPAADEKEGVCNKKCKTVKLPADEVYLEIENPRGQLGFYVQGDGSAIPSRVKARGPSFCNLCILNHVGKDCLLADIPAIIGSMDVVMGEVDR